MPLPTVRSPRLTGRAGICSQARHDAPRDHQPRARLVPAYSHRTHPTSLDVVFDHRRFHCSSSCRSPALSDCPSLPPHRLLRFLPFALHLDRPRLVLRPRPRLLLEPSASCARRWSPRTRQARPHARGRQVRRGRPARPRDPRTRSARRRCTDTRPACRPRPSWRAGRSVRNSWSGGRAGSGSERLCSARTSGGRRTWRSYRPKVGASWRTEGRAARCRRCKRVCRPGLGLRSSRTRCRQEGERGRRRWEVR